MSADFRPQNTLLLAFPNFIDLYTYLAYTCTHALVIAKFDPFPPNLAQTSI